ncbi:hypothetical protein NQ314_017979 [Rhamnusium bicolor]|uniref:Uncharacterized protein n=1 Tax=Rhamnusium bicolor TaxID=1586634 RepID=A0AAV8WS08_9CUCU|nr:hypothetical protein NQ314_017979 [Rhamnusium bicolor]
MEMKKKLEEYAVVFTEHSNKLVEVLVCSIGENAARILVTRPHSKVAQENMDAFKQSWENQVCILTESVDDITSIDEFLAVSENNILEDVNKCVLALHEGSADTLDRTASGIQGRSNRVSNLVTAGMDNYDPCSSPPKEVNENDFIDASRLLYDGVREIRRAVFMNRADDDLDPEDVELDESYTFETRRKSSAHTDEHGVDEYPDISGITNAREAMAKMPGRRQTKNSAAS